MPCRQLFPFSHGSFFPSASDRWFPAPVGELFAPPLSCSPVRVCPTSPSFSLVAPGVIPTLFILQRYKAKRQLPKIGSL